MGVWELVLTAIAGGKLNTAMHKPFQISRRSFIRSCTVTAATTALPLWFVEREFAEAAEQATPTLPAANDRPGIALIGCGGQGSGDLQGASKFGNVVALCDVKENQANGLVQR